MRSSTLSPRPGSPRREKRRRKRDGDRRPLRRLIENDLISKISDDEYRSRVKRVYGGPKGAMLSTCSALSLHIPLGKRIFRSRKFDLRGARRILDVGSGAGQIAGHVLRFADEQASVACVDLSDRMLRRARTRLAKSSRIDDASFVAADLCYLPFVDGAFDCITCGYVLEHLPQVEDGLAELARVLAPGGRMFLLTTEDSFSGAWTSRMWLCRTYNRRELKQICQRCGLHWRKELWFTPMHKAFRAGGICVEIVKQ